MPDLARRILRWVVVGWVMLLTGILIPFVSVFVPIAFCMGIIACGLSIYGLVICEPVERMWYMVELLCFSPWVLIFIFYVYFGTL